MKNKDDKSAILPLDTLQAMRERRSVRAFLNLEVPSQILRNILEAARWAPSGVNTQPWQVAILGPQTRRELSAAIIQAREKQVPENPDYHYYPEEWVEPYKSRRKACGLALYKALQIEKNDSAKRKIQWYRNYYFFDAPIGLIFYLDGRLCKGSWMDAAMFIQNVMLAARHYGLETCPQAALAEYPDIVRTHLQLDSNQHIICGMAMGYADWENPVNQYRTARENVTSFTTWHD